MLNHRSLHFINQKFPKLRIKLLLCYSTLMGGFFILINSISASDRYHNVALKKSDLKGTGWLTFEDLIKWALVTICTLLMVKFAITAGNKVRNSQGWSTFLSLVGIVCCAVALNIFRRI